MNTTKIRSSLSLVFLLGATIASLAACGAEVVVGDGQGSTASAGGNGGSNGGWPSAIAMLYSELPSADPTGTSSGSGGGPGPDTLYIAFGNDTQLCDDPFQAQPCGNRWRVSFGIPVELQKVGIISLSDPSIIANFSATGPIEASNQCYGGGGSFFEGTLEIREIDGNHVDGVLANTPTSDFDANVAFNAVRCQF